MLEFLREIGFTGSADQLKNHARMLLKKYFEQEGKFFVSYELGLMVIPDERFGELAWVIRRMTHAHPKPVEVVVDE